MMTNVFRDAILNTMRGTNLTAWTPYVGLIQSITNFRTPTLVEAAYTGYGTRPSIGTLSAPADTTPAGGRQTQNSAQVQFPTNTGSAHNIVGWGLWDAATVGSCHWITLLDADPAFFGTALTTDTITAVAHGLSNDQRVFVMASPGAVLPTGLSEGTAYFVIGATADTFQLSATQGGAAVDITVGGAAMFMPYTTVSVGSGVQPSFDATSLTLQL